MKWFKSNDVDEFADSIVADLQRRFPPSGLNLGDRKATERIQKTHQAIYERIDAFGRSTDLNLYRKARLGNRVKWALTEAGYPKPFVDAFTHELVTVVALAKASRTAKQK